MLLASPLRRRWAWTQVLGLEDLGGAVVGTMTVGAGSACLAGGRRMSSDRGKAVTALSPAVEPAVVVVVATVVVVDDVVLEPAVVVVVGAVVVVAALAAAVVVVVEVFVDLPAKR